VGVVEIRPAVLPGASDHLPLGVDADGAGADQSRFDQRAARPAHRVEDRRARFGAGEVDERAGVEGGHTAGLEERAVGRRAVAVVAGALGSQPADETGVVGETGSEFVVGVVEVDGEAAVDERRSEFAFGASGVDFGRSPHVAGADGHGSRAVHRGRLDERSGVVDSGLTAPEQPAGPMGVGERPEAIGIDAAGRREAGRDHLDRRRCTRRLPGGEGVVLACEFETVHARHSDCRRHEATEAAAEAINSLHQPF